MKGILGLAQDFIPYILTAALIAVGALLAYLILTTGPPSPQPPTSTSSAGTSVYSAGFPASLPQVSSPTSRLSPEVITPPSMPHWCQSNGDSHTVWRTPLGAADCFG